MHKVKQYKPIELCAPRIILFKKPHINMHDSRMVMMLHNDFAMNTVLSVNQK